MLRCMFAGVVVLGVLGAGCDDGGGVAPGGDSGPRCASNAECDDGVFCNGQELCQPGLEGATSFGCTAGGSPCVDGQVCDEEADRCETMCMMSPDADGDGVDAVECGGTDCDDSDASRFPGNVEVCDIDFHDEDCDPSTVGGRDGDGDAEVDFRCCNDMGDGPLCGVDCNDARRVVNTTTSEVCDGFDNDCDGEVDEGVAVEGFEDRDRDGFGDSERPRMACAGARGFALEGGDCDDTLASVRPGWVELCDGLDNDCNGVADETTTQVAWYVDADGDGFGSVASGAPVLSCGPLEGRALLPGDCDDGDPAVSPGAPEICDGRDNDCNGLADFVIEEGDGEDDDRDGAPDARCGTEAPDCDDLDAFTASDAEEICDGRDNDCDGITDEMAAPVPWYADMDGDGFGDPVNVIESCEIAVGRVRQAGDCDDGAADVNPLALDGCAGRAGVDDDCDGRTDESPDERAVYRDRDGDGWGEGEARIACEAEGGTAPEAGDCAPFDPEVYPGAPEVCDDGDDDDCDALVDCEDPDCDAAPGCERTSGVGVVEGGDQSAPIGRFFPSPITLRVTDLAGAPLPGAEVRLVEGPLGAAEDMVTADGEGLARFTLRAAGWPGVFEASFVAEGARPIGVQATTTAPAQGQLFTLLNADLTYGLPDAGVPGPSPFVASGASEGLVVHDDGTVFFADRGRVYRIAPNGFTTHFAGTGGAYSGDFGAALEAGLDLVEDLALSADGNQLFVATRLNASSTTDGGRVRVIDLVSGEIRTVAGGGASTADGVPATTARFIRVSDVEAHPDGRLFVAVSTNRYTWALRVVDVDGTIDTIEGVDDAITEMALDREGRLLIAQSGRISRIESDGRLTHIAGMDGGEVRDGAPALTSDLGTVSGLAVDAGGNLIFSEFERHVVRRIDARTGLVQRLAGTGESGNEGDLGPAREAELDRPEELALHPDGHLLVADTSNDAIRGIWGPVEGMSPDVQIAIEAGDGGSPVVNAPLSPLVVRVETSDGSPIDGRRVVFESDDPGVALLPAEALSAGGVATIGVRAPLAPGPFTVRARAFDLVGDELATSPVEFHLMAEAPMDGHVFTALGSTEAETGAMPSAASVATLREDPAGAAVGPGGTLYLAMEREYRVLAVEPGGGVQVVAGDGSYGDRGDYGPATGARFEAPEGVCVDRDRDRLYVVDGGARRIRFVDLVSGEIRPFAGGGTLPGPSYGDGGPALVARLVRPASCLVLPDGRVLVLDVGAERIRAVDPGDGVIRGWLSPGDGDAALSLDAIDTNSALALGPDGQALVLANFTGDDVGTSSSTNALVRVRADGSLVHVAGRYFGTEPDGNPATGVALRATRGLAVDATGAIYLPGVTPYVVHRIDPATGLMSRYAGDGMSGYGPDYAPALDSSLYANLGLVWWNGHLAILEHPRVRVVW